jgi:nitrous oxidase accessory protein NosD
LNPLKPKFIIDRTVELTGLPANVVKAVIESYYSEVHRNMSQLTAVNININGLGTVSIKKKALVKKIEETEKMVGHLGEKKDLSKKSMNIYLDKTKDLEVLRNAYGMLEEERLQRAIAREEKARYYEESQRDTGQQKENT